MAFDGRVISNFGVLAAIVEGGSFACASESACEASSNKAPWSNSFRLARRKLPAVRRFTRRVTCLPHG
jgi:hypothetical protein